MIKLGIVSSSTGVIVCILATHVITSPLQQNLSPDEDDEHYPDSDEREDAAVRRVIANRFGLTNFSGGAIAEKASGFVINFLTGGGSNAAETKKKTAKVRLTTTERTTQPPAPAPGKSDLVLESSSNNDGSFVITLPAGFNSSIIEMHFPSMGENSSSQMNTSSMNVQAGVNNIEAAILEALLQAQINAMTAGTQPSSDLAPVASPTSRPARKTRRPSTRPTTPDPRDVLGVGPVVKWLARFVREGNPINWTWTNLIRYLNTDQAAFAAEVVDCQVFYNCDNENELGSFPGETH